MTVFFLMGHLTCLRGSVTFVHTCGRERGRENGGNGFGFGFGFQCRESGVGAQYPPPSPLFDPTVICDGSRFPLGCFVDRTDNPPPSAQSHLHGMSECFMLGSHHRTSGLWTIICQCDDCGVGCDPGKAPTDRQLYSPYRSRQCLLGLMTEGQITEFKEFAHLASSLW